MSLSHDVSPFPTSANDQEASAEADGLNERQQNAINLLLEGATDKAAAEGAGVSRRTIYRWKHQDETFMAELHRRRCALNDEHTDRLRALLGKGLDVLERHVKDRYGPVCHRAAKTLLTITGLGKTLGLTPNVGIQAPKAPLHKPEAPGMSAKTMRTLIQAVQAIDTFAGNNGPNASRLASPRPAAA